MEGFHGKGLWVVDADGGGLHRLACRCRISVEEGYGVTWSRAVSRSRAWWAGAP